MIMLITNNYFASIAETRQRYSTSHALINITENTRKAFDGGNIGCGVFADLQKTFDTVDHQILFA